MDTKPELKPLNLAELHTAVAERGAAFRLLTRLQPAGGPGDKVFPPTYVVDDKQSRSKYAIEKRRIGGADVDVVLLDSVASQANRMEDALFVEWEAGQLDFPVIGVDFSQEEGLADLGFISALHAPHRIADALLRDALTSEGLPFRDAPEGKAYTQASLRNATVVYNLCPTGLVFGVWNSTALAKGDPQHKFQRCLVSEIVGVAYRSGQKVGSRLDPTGIEKVGAVYHSAGAPYDWTIDESEAFRDGGKALLFSRKNVFVQRTGTSEWTRKSKAGDKKDDERGKVTSVNHSNIPPTKDDEAGGVTFDYAQQTTVLSLPALRRLRFVEDAAGRTIAPDARAAAEAAARTALAALALAAVVLAQRRGLDLRSRALLVPETGTRAVLQLIPTDGGPPIDYELNATQALELVKKAAAVAAEHGLAWTREPLRLTPMPKLSALIRESRRLATAGLGDDLETGDARPAA